MHVDQRISRLKYDRQVGNLGRQKNLLRSWGCFLVNCTFPHVEALFLPSNPFVIEFPAWIQTGQTLQLAVANMQVDSVVGRAFGVRIDMEDYDLRAPSVTFRNPTTWELAPFNSIPTGHFPDESGHPRPVVLDAHPVFERPFLCIQGIREFHEHPQHTDVDWFTNRNGFNLFTILEMIWRTCCLNCRPRVLIGNQQISSSWVFSTKPEVNS